MSDSMPHRSDLRIEAVGPQTRPDPDGTVNRHVLVAVPRLVATLAPNVDVPPLGDAVWGDTRLVLPTPPARGYHNIFTDQCVEVSLGHTGAERKWSDAGARPAILAADAFRHFPIAIMEAR